MNTAKKPEMKHRFAFLQSGMTFQLWVMMMSLVAAAVLFTWIFQVILYKNSFKDAVLQNTLRKLEPVTESLQNGDYSDDVHFFPFLSRLLDARIALLDQSGKPIAFYSYGYQVELREGDPEYFFLTDPQSPLPEIIRERRSFQQAGSQTSDFVSVQLGIPVLFRGEEGYLLIHQESRLDTIQYMNRRQTLVFGFLMTVSACFLAAVFSLYFTRPLLQIKDGIERLAENDFSVSLDLKRTDEIGRLADAVNNLGGKLKRLDTLRKELIANISHEFKSPLSLISGYAELVRDIDRDDRKKRDSHLNLIIEESRRMNEMVNDILDYSQFQSGFIRLNPEVFDFCELTESEVARCAQSASENRVTIAFLPDSECVTVRLDPLKISQVLRNLLNNAVNHTPDGGQITVRLKLAGHRDGTEGFRLLVSNPGDPIPEEDREFIWERYYRSQHQSGRRMGTGIGLSIVSTILDAHGMAYGVDCTDGETIFWFSGETEPDRPAP